MLRIRPWDPVKRFVSNGTRLPVEVFADARAQIALARRAVLRLTSQSLWSDGAYGLYMEKWQLHRDVRSDAFRCSA